MPAVCAYPPTYLSMLTYLPLNARSQLPLGDDPSELSECLLRFALIDSSCDYLAKTLQGPTFMSTAAHLYCPDCDYDKTAADHDAPFSFLKGCMCTSSEVRPKWTLRTLEKMLKDLDHAWDGITSKAKRKKFLQAKGYRFKGVKGVRSLRACGHAHNEFESM